MNLHGNLGLVGISVVYFWCVRTAMICWMGRFRVWFLDWGYAGCKDGSVIGFWVLGMMLNIDLESLSGGCSSEGHAVIFQESGMWSMVWLTVMPSPNFPGCHQAIQGTANILTDQTIRIDSHVPLDQINQGMISYL